MKVLIVGGGGREHALAWKIAQNPEVTTIYSAPGNAGLAQVGNCYPVAAEDIANQVSLVKELRPDLVVVGPETPLDGGLIDQLTDIGIPAFGPTSEATKIESSKIFAKLVMRKARVATARFKYFVSFETAINYLGSLKPKYFPVVIKANGLALGKGVFVCHNRDEAQGAAKKLMVDRVVGDAGKTILIEEFLKGQECSVLAICNGLKYIVFPAVQDHKRLGKADSGPNTGGMGAVTPVPGCHSRFITQVIDSIIQPTLLEMFRQGMPFKGCLYAGLILTQECPKVLEFNARFGDPETQVLLPILKEDLLTLMLASIHSGLENRFAEVSNDACVCVVAASGGYPGKYEKGKVITGLTEAEADGAIVFHAGTALRDGELVTNGGRVLNVVSTGPDLTTALDRAYQALGKISFEGMIARPDIGLHVL